MAKNDGGGDGPGAVASPRRADARHNRELLVAAARETFAAAGPDASLNEIARRAGVGPGTLYRHFPTRHALLTAVLRSRIESLCAHAERLSTSGDAGDARDPDDAGGADGALAEWMAAFLAHARANQGLGSALMLDGPDALGIDCHRMIQDAAAGVLERAQRWGTARPDVTADDLLRLVTGIALSTARSPGDDAQPDRLLALALDAVHGERGGARG
ncbi:TetR/AcrR family transcriptional regulator [Streptomyces sp. SID3343]|uniref:TetR/AcrR family transcriptional regulator n=1 Tax=Streptomyces sp. SID3343 TaxID=2690260 RepID=UPI00136B301B|nr:TetR/AcrR family transcriptional regulator [Streptomyces sp. SID3343]MYW00848.1 TetR family transcriptional regulator [Streptomyces sp. SID3343]